MCVQSVLLRMRTNYRVRHRIKFSAAMKGGGANRDVKIYLEQMHTSTSAHLHFRTPPLPHTSTSAHLRFCTPQKCGKSQCTCLRVKWFPCLRPITPPRSVDSALPEPCQVTAGNKSCTGGSNGTVNIFALRILSEGGCLF